MLFPFYMFRLCVLTREPDTVQVFMEAKSVTLVNECEVIHSINNVWLDLSIKAPLSTFYAVSE